MKLRNTANRPLNKQAIALEEAESEAAPDVPVEHFETEAEVETVNVPVEHNQSEENVPV